MAKRKEKNNRVQVFVEVLQNGELLSRTSRPYNKPGKIFLSSHPDSELTAPFYPLPTDIQLIKITRRGVEIDLDPNWEGFTTHKGKIEEISSDKRTNYTHIMKEGDYGSIAYNDLRILVRIGRERPPKKELAKLTSDYRGKVLDSWIGSSLEKKIILAATLASLWIFGGLFYGLLNRPDTRPQALLELKPAYTLPFINPQHLRKLPEALQENYQRKDVIGSTYKFFENFAATIMGFPVERHPAIFRNSYESYQRIHRNNRLEIEGVLEKQKEFESRLLAKQATAIIRIPTIHGETFEGSLLRLIDKLDILHQNLDLTLQSRISSNAAFRKDNQYDYEAYRRLPLQATVERPQGEGIESLRRRERAMYNHVQTMANYAAFHQERIKKFREPVTLLSKDNSAPIAITDKDSILSFLQLDNWPELNQKIAFINASEFDAKQPQRIREPLLGEIEPHLIRQLIDKHRFELQLCFELALRRNQNLSGKMEWQWRLDSRGRISDLELLQTNIDDRRMIRCVQQKIARWPFPRPRRGSVQIQYPFHFAPARG